MSRIAFDPEPHRYTVDGVVVPSVTQIIGRTVPKFLTDWSAKMAAEYACSRWSELTNVDHDTRLQRIAKAHTTYSHAQMQRGSEIHATAQQVIYGQPITVAAYAEEAEAYARFLDDFDIQPLAAETILASPELGYAGSADLWATIGRLDNQRAVIDIKTGSGVYHEISLQLAAYRFAQLMRYDDGSEAAPPEVDAAYCIHIKRPRGGGPVAVDLRPIRATGDDFRQFCALISFAEWLSSKPVGKPLPREAAA